MIDVDKLLRLDYLNDLIMQISDSINDKNKLFVSKYSFEILRELSLEEINEIFNKYNISNENYIKYLESDFLDESWEYADLYSDDINYSFEQKEKLKELALNEIIEINKKIDIDNDKIQEEIDVLDDYLKKLNIFYKAINDDDLIVDEEVNQLKEFIMTYPLIEDNDRFKLSVNVIKHLITSGKIILLKKELVDTDDFEKELDKLYSNALAKNNKKIKDLPYGKFINDYYKKYKFLFDEQGYNDIFEFMIGTSDLFNESADETNSFIKSVFCIRVAGLLYRLNYCTDEDVIQDTLTKLIELDDFYSEDSELNKFKEKQLKKIDEFRSKLSDSKFNSFADKAKLMNRLKVLQLELENNIFNKKRKKELKEEFENLYVLFGTMLENVETIEKINQSCDKVDELLKTSDIIETLGNELYNELVSVQEKLLKLQRAVKKKGVDKDISSKFQTYMDTLLKVDNKLNVEEKTKLNLKGFVLFAGPLDGQSYVLTDLDLANKDNLIDNTIKSEKLEKGYENYSKLINDLHLLGDVEKLSNKDNDTKNNKLCERIFVGDDKSESTDMFILKTEISGVEKLVCLKILLQQDTVLYKQVTEIIREILPNISFDDSEDISLYICFVSAMKTKNEDIYEVAINRYSTESPLYMMFIDDKNKKSLTDEECKELKDYIQLTLQAYLELENKNPSFNFNIIRQVGGLEING